MLIDYLAVYLHSTNETFTCPSMLICKHHYNVINGSHYEQYNANVYKYENYRLVTTDTPFLYL